MDFSALITTLVPIYLIFAFGIALRKAGVFCRDDATVLLKTIFYISLPALMAYAIMNVELSREYAVLPIVAPIIVLLTFGISWAAGRLQRLPRPTMGTFFIGTMIMNITFMYPVVQGLYGVHGVSKMAMFDAGQGIMAFSFAYFIACWYSQQSNSGQLLNALLNACKSPPMWAILAGLCLNLFQIPLAPSLKQTLLFLGNATTPLVMLSMGILFSPKISKLRVMLSAVGIRMIGGSLMGLILAALLGLEGETRIIAVLGAAAPAGHSTLTFSAIKRLDIELAAALVPVSVLFSIPYIAFLLTFLQ